MSEDYYSLLGLQKGATDDEINKAYKTLSKKYHPDKNLEDKEKAEEMFKKINHAKNILLDSEKRRIYDESGEEGLKGGGNSHQDIFNMFNGMFGGFNFFNNRQPEKKVHQQIVTISLTLEDVYKGYNSTKKFNVIDDCERCEGTGKKEVEKCRECNGSGFINVIRQIGPGMISQSRTGCSGCNQKGKKGSGSGCENCEGKGQVSKVLQFDISFPKGVSENSVIQKEKEGIQFVFIAKIESHPVFQREGNNLVIIKEISLYESLKGYSFDLNLLNGERITISNKPEEVFIPSKAYIIHGLGLNENGILKIFFKVNFPEKINKEGKSLNEIFKVERKDDKVEEKGRIFYLSN
jgi:DnaJ-class molecular chaperone